MPTVLVHGASIGELLAAEAVVTRLRDARPAVRIVYSHTSPSVAQWPAWPADRVERMALPLPGLMDRWLRRLAPDLVLLSRGDLWPAMVAAAGRRGIPVAVIGGRVRPGSLRLRPLVRPLLAPAARRLSLVGAVAHEDADRWRALGTPAARITVTGDPAVDRLLERPADTAVVEPLRAWAGTAPVLVVGGMEPSDRAAVTALLSEAPRALVVPHDPERRSQGGDWRDWRPGEPVPDARVLRVTARGVLADCYHAARAAFVGGGFAGRVHNVDEPAAAGVPALAGPTGVDELVARWRAWRDDPARARQEGAASREALAARAGGAGRTWALLAPLLAPRERR